MKTSCVIAPGGKAAQTRCELESQKENTHIRLTTQKCRQPARHDRRVFAVAGDEGAPHDGLSALFFCLSERMSAMAASQLVIFLHGIGASGAQLQPLATAWKPQLSGAHFATPNAPFSNGHGGHLWFKVDGLQLDPGRIAQAREAFVREAFERLIAQGWTDAIRRLHPNERIYTFFDYFRNAFGRDAGLRLDHVLVSCDLADRLVRAKVDRHFRGWPHTSDHAPVWIELAMAGVNKGKSDRNESAARGSQLSLDEMVY